jgi:undecaprenyl-diphosphatase
MDWLLSLDKHIFLFINHLAHPWILDEVAKFFSGIGSGGAIWLIIALVLFFREEKRDHWFFMPIVFATGLSLWLSEMVLKGIFLRPRPTVDMGAIIVHAADNYSFPSSHATLAFALANVLVEEEPRFRYALYALAIAISFSRMYLGVHYPFDVTAGAILGHFIGYAAMYVSKKLRAYMRS